MRQTSAGNDEVGRRDTLQPSSSGYLPCVPALQSWTGQYEKVKYEINGGNPLLEDSKGTCAISGSPCIEITFHGQTAEPTQKNVENASEEVVAELFPFVSLKEGELGLLQIKKD